ncbi:Dolichyl pyrophosphate Glc1Man9GlcNAc2 alpha-1,3-glucosyltransferase [Geodia barretti]|uniref:Alpha-1,3-glucosyltransferase n=1 Tax=Geodia barretti TaxID=519541 RepID=A0AA35RU29_GEOBA|nr:Dolichyl pyrophosphate Glc1Man9GlcNAc2 alpha-1,3-glucosyltransferase [Geodia barretti]
MKLWKKHNTCGLDFLHCLILCGYASFMFGWHVHEKAIMMVTMPMCLLAMEDGRLWRIFTILSTAAHISLFPLLFNTAGIYNVLLSYGQHVYNLFVNIQK